MLELLGHLTAWAIVGLVVANVLADQIGLPVPSIPTLILVAAFFGGHSPWIGVLLVGSVVACLTAEGAWFWAGRRYGGRVMRLLCILSLSPDSCVSDTQRRFERWGAKVLLVANFVPGLSVIAPPLAGASRMSWPRFLYLSAGGAVVWVGTSLLAGIFLARQVRDLVPQLLAYKVPAAIALVALLVAYVGLKGFERYRFLSMLRMGRITVDDLYHLMQVPPPPLVIDVRSETARRLDPRWIPGALQVAAPDIATHVMQLERDREVILYCTCPNEASAASVAKVLMSLGFKRVRPLLGGLDAWVAAGYPVNTTLVTELERERATNVA
jgi:membrane protein DedA with SNARE-associated domain/rhodanese-related sulfurtransferase